MAEKRIVHEFARNAGGRSFGETKTHSSCSLQKPSSQKHKVWVDAIVFGQLTPLGVFLHTYARVRVRLDRYFLTCSTISPTYFTRPFNYYAIRDTVTRRVYSRITKNANPASSTENMRERNRVTRRRYYLAMTQKRSFREEHRAA